ncbi:hypothetical protein EG329_010238 [Mollisiaceae sp. DMI_Dod_QoI]|nr:hypothetical protein EG329_010238 [Helotiales sp. DMI_Dod_QoI]
MATPTSTPSPGMNDYQISPQGYTRDPTNGPQRGASLSMSTSRQSDETTASQSSGSYSALPPQAAYRTVSSPLPSPSLPECATATRSSTLDMPRSAGYTDKSLRFSGSARSGPKSPTSASSKRKSDTMIDRRLSDDPKTNVYTTCGRHSDEWLFRGFTFNSLKKVWERDKKE